MISPQFAAQFAEEWVAVWNSRDLDRILAHYADDFEMASPYIAAITGEPSGVLKGKAAVAAYWAKALARLPTLRFELHSILIGAESVVIYYKGVSGMVAELFSFNPSGKVSRSSAHYAMNEKGIDLPSAS
ncbi:MAG: nuclear transport factor 2 family protein [Nitrospira sp.]|nr:nuclear transport factor 2 family protein [Nitrospira sp.]